MSWLDIFDNKTKLKHSFGRGINARLPKDEEELFGRSYEAFEKKDILNAYEYFLRSLENYSDDVSNENIIISKEADRLNFTIYQGTAKVTGSVDKESLYAQVIMIKEQNANVAVKRLILERNYQFTYASYFSDEKYIKLKLFFDNITMNPQKIFFPLREIALNADFDKEYIKSEFSNIDIEDIGHITKVDDEELSLKYDFLHRWIKETKEKISALPSNDNAAMQSFLLLHLVFQMDYLIVPRYSIFQKSSKKILRYFADENSSTENRNEDIREYIDELEKIDFDEFKENFYNAKYTFNPTDRTSHEEVKIFIDEYLVKIRWYKNNRYDRMIPAVYGYIALHLLYNCGLHPVTEWLLHILVEIHNPEFFEAMGYEKLYDTKSSTFSKKAIISKIDDVILSYKSRFKNLESFGNKLNYSSFNEFNNSFYFQLKNLDFEEV